MIEHLVRHSEALHQSTSFVYTALWLRILACLTLIVPVWTSLTFGKKTLETSNQYTLATTPPPYFFKIWIVIFFLQAFVMIYAAIIDCWTPEPWYLFIIIDLSCGIWAFTFNYGTLTGVNISILCQFINLFANQFIWIDLGNPIINSLSGSAMGLLIRNMVAFAQGWFIAAAALGLFIVLVYDLGMGHRTQVISFWVLAPLVYAAFLIFDILEKGAFLGTIGLLLSMVWAVLGAAISSRNQQHISSLL